MVVRAGRHAAGVAVVGFVAWAFVGAAAAQGRDCEGSLVTTSVFSRVVSDGSAATVEYRGQFQNQDPARRRIVATVLPISGGPAPGAPRGAQRLDLDGYEQRDVPLFSVRVDDPGGRGAPPPTEIGRLIRTECRFAP